jgi:ABC-2 type transport system permease protein
MFHRIMAITRKEFRQIRRDRRTLAVLLVFPAMMLVLFGYALNFDVKHIGLAVYDEVRTATSRDFRDAFLHSEYFDLKYVLHSKSQVDDLFGRDMARVALIIPWDFSDRVLAGRTATVQVLIDGSNANTAGTALGYVQAIVQDYAAGVFVHAESRQGGKTMTLPIDLRPRVWYNPELKSAKFLVPGLIGFILSITAVISIALSIVRERERNTMEQLVISPVTSSELIIGKILPYILISLVATVVILVAGYFLFGIDVKGSYLWLFVATLAFLTACLSLGLLISTIAETQQVAFQISILSTMLPTFLLSGIVFPIRNMPEIIRLFTYAVPARYFLVALRSIILKGSGVSAFRQDLFFLLGFALVTMAVSMARMRMKRLS